MSSSSSPPARGGRKNPPPCEPRRRRGGGARSHRWIVLITMAGGSLLTAAPAADLVVGARIDDVLAILHADHARWIGRIRTATGGGGLYAGLVRPGGRDPRDPDDAPVPGPGRVHDLVLFPEAFGPNRTAAWVALIVDHEYFHARHLSGGFAVPLVSFDGRADRHYLEALAWGWVLGRSRDGAYGPMPSSERREVEVMYREHREAFRRFVLERQPSAWAHYGRFLREEDAGPVRLTSVASAP